ncbi:GTP-binding protein [Pseudomonas sp. zjy_15]|uniref:GTP-binding protein n=1 Tax=Pseudomonas TaxID=286 RepID=UPI00210E9278|nr:GTP-binding protein [Pseudomonas putida]WHH50253.1 GTP-binding protein [Pseudomonas sp. Ap32]
MAAFAAPCAKTSCSATGNARHPHTRNGRYGIASFVYRARRPFQPDRFYALVESEWPGVVRSKGYY